MQKFTLIFAFVVSLLAAYFVSHQKGAPTMFEPAPKKPHRMEIHGDVRVDDYFWMRERDTPEVVKFLRQENVRTEEALTPVRGLEHTIFEEMRGRIKEEDASVPVFERGYYHYWRYKAGSELPLQCRRQGSLSAPEEVILDENELAQGRKVFNVSTTESSPDQKILAYAVDAVGNRIFDVFFKDLATGKLLPDRLKEVTADFVWAEDNKTLFYIKQEPETLRSYQLYRWQLGSGQPAELLYEEKDATFSLELGKSKTNRFIFVSSDSSDVSEVRYLDLADPKGQLNVFLPRQPKHQYSLDDAGDHFLILTNYQAKNFRVMQAPYTARAQTQWKEVIPHNPAILREGLDVYEKFMVVSERENGLTQLRVVSRGDHKERLLKFEDPAYDVSLSPLPEYTSESLRFNYQSPVQPPSVFDENALTGTRELKKRREVPNYDASRYEARRTWATAKDGTKIPISLVMRKGTELNGNNPVLLYGYGSYGLSMDPYFRGTVFSLLDRGFVYAIAHIRGGSEMGRAWYENGRMEHKMNTFTDFIASAEALIAEKYTSPEHLHIMGASAGGLLMGAVMNLRPELFKSVVAGVPFVDVISTMLDESLPLTTGEFNEWGNPKIKEQYQWIRAYSPYDNVTKKAYPHLLAVSGYHDSQVQYWEPSKWVAKLREYKTDDHLLLLHTQMETGHSGATGRFEALKTLAKEYAFILMIEGIKQ